MRTIKWLKALVAAIIGGIANAGLSVLTIKGANSTGLIQPLMPDLTMEQLGSICLSGGLVGACLYLVRSPLPPDSTGETEMIKRTIYQKLQDSPTPTIIQRFKR